MNVLSAENISKNFNEKPLLENLTFGISRGGKVALVGRNGSGKSSLLNIITGKIAPDHGTVVIRKEIKTGFLSQNPIFDEELTISDTLFKADNLTLQTIKAYEKVLMDPDSGDMDALLEKMEMLDAWNYEQKIEQIISKLGIKDIHLQIKGLSGGQKKRVALARVLIEEPDFLILDEPTNHLDLDSIEWLENYLSSNQMTILLVTHDRYFLDKVCNEIFELEDGNIYRYKGNYSYFLEKKQERETILKVETEKARNLLKKELEWMRRQPKARGTKAKSRVDAFYEIKEKATGKKEGDELTLSVQTSRQGNKIIELNNISKSYGPKNLFSDFSYTFKKGDRIGIVGKNGTGKSTFLNILTGQGVQDSGTIERGETTALGYYTQEVTQFKPEQRVIETVTEIADYIKMNDGQSISASAFLQHFLFPPAVQYTPVGKLSGGEKKRLQLLRVLMKNPNFLILDEPTNDLDLQTLTILEDFLESFGGCLMIVSHDRYFMDRLVDQLFVFDGNGEIKIFNGNYTDFRIWQDEEEQNKAVAKKTEKAIPKEQPAVETDNKKLSFKEKKEYDDLEKEIESLESKKEVLVTKLNAGNLSHDELMKTSLEIDDLIKAIETKSERWFKLAEKL